MFTRWGAALLLAQSAALAAASVTLDYGTFTGSKDSATGTTSYLGIRYADAPVGNLRFRAPVSPPSKSVSNVSATAFGKACVQVGATTSETSSNSEDCLFGNIYVPSTTATNLPVLVWFHGGGFNSGSAKDFSPNLLFETTAKPFVFVTFNYRLGALGFLAGPQVAADGNMNAGLLDQRAGLAWVKRYISNFGGDPTKVTIWGESAGAGSTMFHLIGNGGDGASLFRGVAGDSPSLNFLPDPNSTFATTLFDTYASKAGCSGQGANAMSCLRSASGNALATAWSQIASERGATFYVFAPTHDGTFINQRPIDAFTSGAFARVPVLFGSNTDEGQTWYRSIRDDAANPSVSGATETNNLKFLQGQFPGLTEASFNKALELYPLASYNNSLVRQSGQMYGEMRYICPALLITGSAEKFGEHGYQFHYDNPHLGARVNGVSLGTTHGSELIAFFGFGQSEPATAQDNALFLQMRKYLTTFVTDQKPVANVTWPAATNTDGSPRILWSPSVTETETISSALSARCAFWRSVRTETST